MAFTIEHGAFFSLCTLHYLFKFFYGFYYHDVFSLYTLHYLFKFFYGFYYCANKHDTSKKMKLNSREMIRKHDDEDKCCFCHGYIENWPYNYDEVWQYYLGHLRHLFVYMHLLEGTDLEKYSDFMRRCHQYGVFEKSASRSLWKISVNTHGWFVFTRIK